MNIIYEASSCKDGCKSLKDIGIYIRGNEYFKIQQCEECHQYSMRNKVGSEQQKTIVIEESEIGDILSFRVACPLCKEYEDARIKAKIRKCIRYNHKGFKYDYVRAKGITGKFYCRNHPLKIHNRYEFNYSKDHEIMTLEEFFKSINIDPEAKELSIESESLILFLLQINMRKTLIAMVLGISRQTLYNRMKKDISLLNIESIYKQIITLSREDTRDLSKIIIKIPIETILDTDNVKLVEKKVLFNP